MNSRSLVLVLLLAPMLLFGVAHLRETAGTEPLLPGLEPKAVARVELSRGGEAVVLTRGADGTWHIPSAADAPGDGARIEAMLTGLKALRGRPLDASAPAQTREPLRVQLSDSAGRPLGAVGFWAGEGRALPDGGRLALSKPPALALWPSAWSSLAPPKLAVDRIAAVEELTPDGPKLLSAEATVTVARVLGDLSAKDFVGGGTVSWTGARLLRVKLTDGTVIDLQQVPDGDGRYYLRLTSDSLDSVRATRRYAFRINEPLA